MLRHLLQRPCADMVMLAEAEGGPGSWRCLLRTLKRPVVFSLPRLCKFSPCERVSCTPPCHMVDSHMSDCMRSGHISIRGFGCARLLDRGTGKLDASPRTRAAEPCSPVLFLPACTMTSPLSCTSDSVRVHGGRRKSTLPRPSLRFAAGSPSTSLALSTIQMTTSPCRLQRRERKRPHCICQGGNEGTLPDVVTDGQVQGEVIADEADIAIALPHYDTSFCGIALSLLTDRFSGAGLDVSGTFCTLGNVDQHGRPAYGTEVRRSHRLLMLFGRLLPRCINCAGKCVRAADSRASEFRRLLYPCSLRRERPPIAICPSRLLEYHEPGQCGRQIDPFEHFGFASRSRAIAYSPSC